MIKSVCVDFEAEDCDVDGCCCCLREEAGGNGDCRLVGVRDDVDVGVFR